MELSQEKHAAESQASPSKKPLFTGTRRPADVSPQASTESPKRRRCRPHQPPWKYWENKQLELDIMRAGLDSMERTAHWRAECLEMVIARFRRTVAYKSLQLERFEDILMNGEQLTDECWALMEERYWTTY